MPHVHTSAEVIEPEVDERRLYWVGPMTVVAATLAVWVVQHIFLFILPPLPEFSGRILSSIEPALFTAVLVTLAVFVFAWVAEMASRPLRTFRRIALGALIVSCLPNVVGPITARVRVLCGAEAVVAILVNADPMKAIQRLSWRKRASMSSGQLNTTVKRDELSGTPDILTMRNLCWSVATSYPALTPPTP